MSKIIQITTFNNILNNFFDYLEEEFENSRSDIILTRSICNTIRTGNPRLVVEQFLQHVLPYENQIISCDEDFFLNFENNMNLDNNNILVGLKLKDILLSNTDQDPEAILRRKATIFHFFIKLLKIAKTV